MLKFWLAHDLWVELFGAATFVYLILSVCIPLRVREQDEGFPSTQLYFNSFLLFYST
jgi:hypothetical protein